MVFFIFILSNLYRSIMQERLAKKVLLIGWDAADWKVINPLLDAGLMPALEALINKGAMGQIATLDPPLSPILWTSIGTGKTADKHGILNFTEPNPATGDIQPVTVTSRKVKAIWNILSQQGLKTNLIGWWPSHPAEPINGVCVSNFYQRPVGLMEEPWPLPPGCIHPPDLQEIFAELRVHPGEITASHLRPYVPQMEKVDQEKDKSLHNIATMIASSSSIHSAATWIMENKDWDFLGVYFDTIDHFCHGFMKYHPPRMEGIPQEYFDLYKDVVANAYRFQDMMLERLMRLAGEDTTIILLSDHGFHSDHLRPKRLPQEPAAPALEHSPFGILCMAGQHIKKDERIYGATLLDITPTLLTLFGLPIGKDMDGKPLLQAFDKDIKPEYIESWETVKGNDGMHPPEIQQDPWASQEAMQQLIELGYVEELDGNKQERIKKTKDESDFYLARVHIQAGRVDKATEILARLYTENPDAVRYGLRLASCYQIQNKTKEFRKVIDSLRGKDTTQLPQLDLLEGTLLLAENKPVKALQFLQKAEHSVSHLPYLHIQIGNVYFRMHRWDDAIRAFNKALDIDPNDPVALYGKGTCLLRTKEYQQAAEYLLTAISLNYNFPEAHYNLGECLFYLNEYEDAATAFQAATTLLPGYKKAHQWLVRLYNNHLHQPEKAAQSRSFIEKNIKGTISVIAGLPHSGKTMLSSMLEKEGIAVINRSGKAEAGMEGIESCIAEAIKGHTIVLSAQDLQFLPEEYNYKVVFILRDITGILVAKQHEEGKNKETFPMGFAEVLKKQLERSMAWLRSRPDLDVLYLDHSKLQDSPKESLMEVSAFLGEKATG
jgi:predicted AlkP superfamily phosphohydrolase/phosphomutase/thioredoxin-like negative regulator of GroEL